MTMEYQKGDRIIVLVDMDCFYVQVEQKLQPQYKNKPCAVVQYNTWKGGGIIAVNYEARAKGVSRNKRGEEALKACPDIHLFSVPEVRGKADLTRYREAGASVMEVLCKFSECVERASIDEAYLDLTEVIKSRMRNNVQVSLDQIPSTFVIGWKDTDDQKDSLQSWLQMIYEEDHLYNDQMLATAAVLVEEIRAAVYSETGYRCSAGIAHNKVLAKLTCGLHKPNKQTVLPEASIPLLYKDIPVNKVRGLGGKFGDEVMEKFKAKTMHDLSNLSKQQFISSFGEKSGSWLYYLSRGIENEAVVPRQLPKSIGCGKNFPGKASLNTKEKVIHWVKQLSTELEERLLKDQENNCRVARLLTISVRNQVTPGYSTVSRSCPIYLYNAEKMAHDAFNALQKFNISTTSNFWTPAILSLAMSAGKFEDRLNHSTSDIQSYFKSPKKQTASDTSNQNVSNIDTVIGLLDTEPGLLNNSNDTIIDSIINKIPQTTTGTSTQVSKDISRFFNIQVPSTSKTFIQETTNDMKQDATSKNESLQRSLSRFEDTEPKMEQNVSTNTTSVSIASNDTSSDIQKPKVKGFFARKLEERSRLKKSIVTSESIADTREVKSLERSSTLCKDIEPTIDHNILTTTEKVINDSNNTSSEHQKPKIKGFFARKLEERTRADSAPIASEAVTSTNQIRSCFNADMPSTSALEVVGPSTSSDDLSMQQQTNDYSEMGPELTSICTKCNHRIPIWEEDEHSDYHMALDLSKELKNESTFKKLPSTNLTKQSKTTKKRGRSSKSASTCKKPAQQNTIDTFFK